MEWFGLYAASNTPPATDAFSISFYNTDNTGTPNTNPLVSFTPGDNVNRTPTGGSIAFGSSLYPVYQYTFSLGRPRTLGPGTYGIGIVNDTTNDTDDFWVWATSNPNGTFFGRIDENEPYVEVPVKDLSFRLLNSGQVAVIPEPSEWATGGLIAATLVFGMVRARRRKAAPNAPTAA